MSDVAQEVGEEPAEADSLLQDSSDTVAQLDQDIDYAADEDEPPVEAVGDVSVPRPVPETPSLPPVRGVVEIETGRGQFVPATYVRVVLEGVRRRVEAITNQRGVYLLLEAAPGRYALTVTDAKRERTLHRGEVTIPRADTTITLPDVHITRPLLLWVDDEPARNEVLSRQLIERGVAVWIATSTREAIAELESADYDLVITDMGRSSDPMAGYTLLRSMRDRGLSVPVIVFSTSQTPELHNRQVQDSGAVGQVTRSADLLRLVEETLGRS